MRFTRVAGYCGLMVLLQGLAFGLQSVDLEVAGRIWIQNINAPCQQCQVSLEGMGVPPETTYTDGFGYFRFGRRGQGGYILRVNVAGYEEVEFRGDRNLRLEPVTILLTPQEKPVSDHVVTLDDLARRFPKEAVALVKKASKELNNGNVAKAEAQLQEAIRIAPGFAQAHEDLGRLYRATARYDEAERELLQAKKLNPKNAATLIELTALYINRGQPDQAVQMGEEAIKKSPRSASAFFNLALALYDVAQFNRAEQVLKKALDLSPHVGEIRLLLANVYMKLNAWHEVRAQLDIYLAENPDGLQRADVERVLMQLSDATGQKD